MIISREVGRSTNDFFVEQIDDSEVKKGILARTWKKTMICEAGPWGGCYSAAQIEAIARENRRSS